MAHKPLPGGRHIDLSVEEDGVGAKDAPTPVLARERFPFKVKSPAGMFKNGKAYAKGDTVMLDAETGARAVAAGDVEAPVQNGGGGGGGVTVTRVGAGGIR